jgi:protein-S-isoprenylcysteine O-methyltransferase Ste14
MLIRAIAAFLVLPGMVAIAAPILIAQFDPWRGYESFFGLVLLHIGVFLLFWCIRDFYVSGKGTLAPWDPPQRLVTVGLYKYSRNPMYIAVLLIISGWAAYFGSWLVMAYDLLLAVIFYLRVVLYEEPWLQKTYTTEWQCYQGNVPRWFWT